MDELNHDRRRAGRVDCRFPVLLHSAGRSLRTEAIDLSRVGILVRIPFEEVGLKSEIPLAEFGREATYLLGELVRADLHYEVLGTLVQHSARPVRLGRGTQSEPYLEVGLDFTEPITDMETHALGIDLPPIRDDAPATWIPQSEQAGMNGHKPDVAVVVCNDHEPTTQPLRIQPLHLDRNGVRADLGRFSDLPVIPEQRGAGGVLAMLADTYGGEPLAVILLRGEPVWSGPIGFSAVEMCPYDHTVRLQVSFKHALQQHAATRLGVA
ncbi:MAG: PilZ domain-containing protein [Planctomycetota bacterium]|nr:PilZ domain-containing protein [Planctomycetota bacterium]